MFFICLYCSVNEKKRDCNLVQGWAAMFTQSLSILEMKEKMFNRWIFLKATILCFFEATHVLDMITTIPHSGETQDACLGHQKSWPNSPVGSHLGYGLLGIFHRFNGYGKTPRLSKQTWYYGSSPEILASGWHVKKYSKHWILKFIFSVSCLKVSWVAWKGLMETPSIFAKWREPPSQRPFREEICRSAGKGRECFCVFTHPKKESQSKKGPQTK